MANDIKNRTEQTAERIMNEVPQPQDETRPSAEVAPVEAPSVGTPAEAPAEAPAQPSKRDTFRKGFYEANADLDPEDEDAYYDRASQYMDEHKQYADALGNVRNAIGSSEDFQDLLTSLAEHNQEHPDEPWSLDHFIIDKVRRGEIDLEELAQNEEYANAVTQNKEQKTKDEAEKKLLEEEGEQNYQDSIAMMMRVRDERGLSNDQVNKAMDLAYQIHDELRINKLSEDTFNKILDSLSYSDDVETARQEGEAKGVNRKVRENFRKMPATAERTGGSQSAIPEPEKETKNQSSMFGL